MDEVKNDVDISRWERSYDKIVYELKHNLIYVIVLVLGLCLYKTLEAKNILQQQENERLVKDRDGWRNLATRAIDRNFEYVNILLNENYKTDTVRAYTDTSFSK